MFSPKDIFILVPVKTLDSSKSRLSPYLNASERSELTYLMLSDVLHSLASFPNVFVVTRDGAVSSLAERHGVGSLEARWNNLNLDLEDAYSKCIGFGARSTLTILADLPALSRVDVLKMIELAVGNPAAVIAPSKDNGTNAMLLRPTDLIKPHFGSKSCEEHLHLLGEAGVEAKIYESVGTKLDIDVAEDIIELVRMKESFTRVPRSLEYLEALLHSR